MVNPVKKDMEVVRVVSIAALQRAVYKTTTNPV
jgi:hypothetical protein